jgi:superfamily II DNA helicase RecQ
MVLLRAAAGGKSLVPLTTLIIRTGVTLVLVPLHRLGSDQFRRERLLKNHHFETPMIL